MQRKRRLAVGAWCAAQAEIDAARRDGVEHAELFGHLEGRIMRQHDAGAADPYALGRRGDGRDQDFRRGADDGGMIVMLRQPEAVIAQPLAMPRQRDGIADRGPMRPPGGGNRLV
jgi:hypothetical protein